MKKNSKKRSKKRAQNKEIEVTKKLQKRKFKPTRKKSPNKKNLFVFLAEWRKTKSFGITMICLGTLLFFALGIFLLFAPLKQEKIVSNEYYPADYNENIFENVAYMSMERDLLYKNGKVSNRYNYELHYDEAKPECQFFLKYFDTVIKGDYKAYKDFFVEGYFEKDPKFTMQMIYEPEVTYHSTSKDTIEGKEVELYNFTVIYSIFKNNKTFRNDVDSHVAVPQIYQLLKKQDGSYLIYKIYNVEEDEA